MVRALLDGRKTQTRRRLHNPSCGWLDDRLAPADALPPVNRIWLGFAVGDRLWVREPLRNPGHKGWLRSQPDQCWVRRFHYEADGTPSPVFSTRERPSRRPSIHLPRRASRLTLIVQAVRVERLQDISPADAIAEGIYWSDDKGGWTSGAGADEGRDCCASPEVAFEEVWNHIHGEGAWEANPWVVAVTFAVERRNIDAQLETFAA